MGTAVLTDFLLARVAEDEAVAVTAAPGWTGPEAMGAVQGSQTVLVDPARILAECEAKRRIVDAHADAWGRNLHSMWGADMRGGLGLALRALALPYADHPDYRQEWKP